MFGLMFKDWVGLLVGQWLVCVLLAGGLFTDGGITASSSSSLCADRHPAPKSQLTHAYCRYVFRLPEPDVCVFIIVMIRQHPSAVLVKCNTHSLIGEHLYNYLLLHYSQICGLGRQFKTMWMFH